VRLDAFLTGLPSRTYRVRKSCLTRQRLLRRGVD
jgi:hypothetical protein